MLIVLLGVGVEFSLLFSVSYQRYPGEFRSGSVRFRAAQILAVMGLGGVGLSGFLFIEEAWIRNDGLILLLGSGYSLLGAGAFLWPFLHDRYVSGPHRQARGFPPGSPRRDRVLYLFRRMESHPRIFARLKIQFDPMFQELDRFFQSPRKIVDIGCGYGVPACWLLDRFPQATAYCMEPDPERFRVATTVIGKRGVITHGGAPDLPQFPKGVDAAMMLDMIHYLTGDELAATCRKLYPCLHPDGRLVIRVTVPADSGFSWWRFIEKARSRMQRRSCHFRSLPELNALLGEGGFQVETVTPSGRSREETWIIARAEAEPCRG
jgi:SAM-dependent methyltransferase